MEKETEEYLIKNNIKFEIQKKFRGLGYLFYDFYLLEYNSLIECDGIQHFKVIDDFFHYGKDFLNQKKRDIRKNAHALKKNINILRIAYTDSNFINSILTAFIKRVKGKSGNKSIIVFSNPKLYKNTFLLSKNWNTHRPRSTKSEKNDNTSPAVPPDSVATVFISD
jgi:very-short-patch-repair endonuclease